LCQQAAAAGEDPNRVARHLAGADGAAVLVLHSTSWRWEPPGVVVLTYVAVVEDLGPDLDVLVNPLVVTSGHPLRPRPDGLHEHHVVTHAVRNLAFLAARDQSWPPWPPTGNTATNSPPWAALPGVTATTTFEQAHPGPEDATGPTV
jgi:hypothetical protein